MGRIRSRVRVSASFQMFALRMLLHSARALSPGGDFSLGGKLGGMSSVYRGVLL